MLYLRLGLVTELLRHVSILASFILCLYCFKFVDFYAAHSGNSRRYKYSRTILFRCVAFSFALALRYVTIALSARPHQHASKCELKLKRRAKISSSLGGRVSLLWLTATPTLDWLMGLGTGTGMLPDALWLCGWSLARSLIAAVCRPLLDTDTDSLIRAHLFVFVCVCVCVSICVCIVNWAHWTPHGFQLWVWGTDNQSKSKSVTAPRRMTGWLNG